MYCIGQKIQSSFNFGRFNHKTEKKRNKLLRIADKSEGGWKTVEEYLSDAMTSDSEDEKRIRAADNRAVRKIKSVRKDGKVNRKRPV